MRFGVSTWFFQEYPLVEALKHILDCGFQAAEIWMQHLWHTEQSAEDIAECARDLGLELTLHSASYDVNITSTNPGIRQESLRQVKQAIITGKRLGVRTVVIRPGHLSSSKENFEHHWSRMENTFALLNKWAKRHDIKISVEMMEKTPKEVFMLPEHVTRIMRMGWDSIGLTLDIAHAFTHMDPVGYIDQLQPRWITHAHLSDGSQDATHLPLGQGEINIREVLKVLDKVYDGLVILGGSVPSHGHEIVASNKAYLRKLGWM
jgi:sugar phosphate isomerase/epimerase